MHVSRNAIFSSLPQPRRRDPAFAAKSAKEFQLQTQTAVGIDMILEEEYFFFTAPCRRCLPYITTSEPGRGCSQPCARRASCSSVCRTRQRRRVARSLPASSATCSLFVPCEVYHGKAADNNNNNFHRQPNVHYS